MNVLLVGCGPIAVSYAEVLTALGVRFDVVGRGQTSAGTFFAKTGVKPYLGGLNWYLAERGFNQATAAIVALPVPALAKSVDCLANAGIARVLVEKPAGLTEQEIGDLARRISHLPTQVFVAFNRRFYQSSIVARSLIAEDGGVTSFHVEFTERADRIASTAKDPAVLQNWFLANSCHVLDLAFELGGRPTQLSGQVHGSLPWHPAGAIFVGSGKTDSSALFSWHADWSSAGRWGVDLRTSRRRIVLQPLETIQVQSRGDMVLANLPIDDAMDRDFKPGFYRQVEAFLSPAPELSSLQSLSAHADLVATAFMAILSPDRRGKVDAA
jgi:predicted dehydrogenase